MHRIIINGFGPLFFFSIPCNCTTVSCRVVMDEELDELGRHAGPAIGGAGGVVYREGD